MDNRKKLRRATRTQFTKMANLVSSQTDIQEREATFKMLEIIVAKLHGLDTEIENLMGESCSEADFEKEIDEVMSYNKTWISIQEMMKTTTSEELVNVHKSNEQSRKFKLPVLETKKFDGNVKNWLPFWGQFQKINDDESLDASDKFQYLIQAMAPGTEVRRFVESYPSTTKSYKEALNDLKERYARDELLIQVYVRELLKMIVNKKEQTLTQLYDHLSTHLRALETLGVTKQGYASFILPMVESTLPIEILRMWERLRPTSGDELGALLAFLKKEVESEQRIKIATGFITENETESQDQIKEATAATLIDGVLKPEKKITCLWCDKEHSSSECYKLCKLTLDQRKEHIKKKNACMICLKIGHHAKVCKKFIQCFICKKRHSATLCPSNSLKQTISNFTSQGSNATLLQTVMVKIVNGDKQVIVRALIDNGSQRTYLKKDVAQKLGLHSTGKELLTHNLFSGVQVKSSTHNIYNFSVKSVCDQTFELNLNALEQSVICSNLPSYIKDNDCDNLMKRHGITLTDSDKGNTDISLLIGADHSGYIMTNTIVMLKEGLFAIKTRLGWVLQGKVNNVNSNIINTLFCSSEISDFWSLELLGIRDPVESKTKIQAEADAVISFEENITVNMNGRYEVALPFKVGHEDLQSNRGLAEKRLTSNTKRLLSSGKFTEYNNIINEWESEGIIEKVPESEINQVAHYLPHRGVIKDTSLTTKLRPVFDASACDKNGRSLNSYLNKGVNFLDKMPHLLMGFRRGMVGISADIAKAFLNVSIRPVDRDYLRFLWWKDDTQKEIIEYRHCRVVFGLTSSPFLLSATIGYHLKQRTGLEKHTADMLVKAFYVDNCITSMDSEQDTCKFISEAKAIMKNGKFDLRQWVTSPMKINETGNKIVSVLGLLWNTETDTLSCNLENLPLYSTLGKITKKNLMSLIQRIYDPVGFSCPVTLPPRLIMQETWKRGLSWEEILPNDLEVEFKKWYKYLFYLKECKIPRRLTTSRISGSTLSLHLFSDASKHAYGACVLLRSEKDGNVSVQMLIAKSRVSPTENVTIPRLELTAALIGSRLLAETKKSLGIADIKEYCWTDSCVTFYWITRNLPWNKYVHNRVKEIRENTNHSNWYHISGNLNWADVASRGCNAEQLLALRWWEGPAWLRLCPEEWPKSTLKIDDTEANKELKKTETTCNTSLSMKKGIERLYYISKYTKIIRTLAWILRIIHNMFKRNKITNTDITLEEYELAEKKIVKWIQETEEEYLKIQKRDLVTYLDEEGLLRIKTKLLLSDFPESTKFPVLLPGKNIIVRRLVEQRHRELKHAGANQLTADLRTRFWIIGIRRLAKSVISSCIICTRFRSKPVQVPTAPLPSERILCSSPFQVSGVDLAGPLYLRNGESVWVVLYTCAVYRCVHLELTKSLSTESFIMTLRRFIARRGRIKVLISDNGTNFIGTKNRLAQLDWEKIESISTIERIKWKMNAPTASWWGGFFERLIRIMKEILRRVLGQSRIDYEELETILYECEAVINQRPLTYIQDDQNTHLEPLTPSCFIQSIPNSDVTDLDAADANTLNLRLKYMSKLRDDYKQRFKTEYLTALVQRGKEKQTELNIGDVVLIQTDEKRVKWPLGVITNIYIGKDGINRTAEVRTSLGCKVRPVQRLYPLEISSQEYNQLPSCSQDAQDQFPNNFIPVSEEDTIENKETDNENNLHKQMVDQNQKDEASCEAKMSLEKTTRCGRAVRMPRQ